MAGKGFFWSFAGHEYYKIGEEIERLKGQNGFTLKNIELCHIKPQCLNADLLQHTVGHRLDIYLGILSW